MGQVNAAIIGAAPNLGPCPCQGCGRPVYWTGLAWTEHGWLAHHCEAAPVTMPCACGGQLTAFADGIAAAVRRHNQTPLHRKWRDAA